MSVQQFISALEHANRIMSEAPRVWCILANSIWGRAESLTTVALFDSEAEAWAYVGASRLPSPVRTTERTWGMVRAHRPDSLLWDFNHVDAEDMFGAGVREANNLAIDFGDLARRRAINPALPTGSLAARDFPNLAPGENVPGNNTDSEGLAPS